MFNIVVLISGRGSNLLALAESIVRGEVNGRIVGVISDNPQAQGLKICETFGIATRVVERLSGQISVQEFHHRLINAVSSFSPDLVILAGFMRIVPPELITKFKERIINIHPSLLPAFKGLHAQKQALDAGVKFSGCTVHLVEPELDSGKILAQAIVPVLPSDDLESLSARILEEEHKLLPATVNLLLTKQLP